MILRVCSTPGACVDMNGSEQVSKTAVLTDSASDIPRELEEKYGIDILPFSIVVDGQSYTERVDFTNEQYYEMLTKAEGIPKTSQIDLRRKFGLNIIAIERGEQTMTDINPAHVFAVDDIIVVVGKNESIQRFEEHLV